jgi:uncharacterized protein (DUF488 family)
MRFFTVGYGGRSPTELAQLLAEHGVRMVVDVRLRPDKAAMGSYVKAKQADKGIEKVFGGRGIAYRSFVELGNPFIDRENWSEPYEQLLDRAGDLLTSCLDGAVQEPFCLLCAEKRVEDCHRRHIANYLVRAKGWELVEHL